MMNSSGGQLHEKIGMQGRVPQLGIKKLGIVSRDYNYEFPNGYYDFSFALPQILDLLDKKSCNAVVFSLYSIVPRWSFEILDELKKLKNINVVFLEEVKYGVDFTPKHYVVYYKSNGEWHDYRFWQQFGSLRDFRRNVRDEMELFIKDHIPGRILGKCCVILCGESNGVKYSRTTEKAEDTFGLRAAIPPEVNIILNPVHDRMTRHEMPKKRQFLSKPGRWVVSVWNKGKTFGDNGRTRDGIGPAWQIFHHGEEKNIAFIPNELSVEIGILDVTQT